MLSHKDKIFFVTLAALLFFSITFLPSTSKTATAGRFGRFNAIVSTQHPHTDVIATSSSQQVKPNPKPRSQGRFSAVVTTITPFVKS